MMLLNKWKPQLRYLCTKANNTFYVTTPIFYVNAAPHIGHLYSAVIADAVARYQKLRDPTTQVHLLTGTDEHGTKIQQAAALHNVPVVDYCNNIASSYLKVFKQANVAYTDFIRTTEQRHELAVTAFWRSLQQSGHIYAAQYSGWYCVSDETFLTETQLRVDEDTGARYSLESNHPVEWTQEQNYMFRLSNMQDEVRSWVQKGDRIRPAKFEKILLDMLSEPLPDVSISRPANRVHWAIRVPGDNTQTVYVWLDALINYLTSIGYPHNKYQEFWPANLQVIGKDILKFHGIYWPAFLLAAGLAPPRQLLVHSHWTVDGQKMSKSKYNVVDPLEAAKLYSMEGLRYFLLREGVAHSDGNYSSTKALRILNSELADTLGNLLSRACAKALNPQQIYPCFHEQYLENIMQMDAAKQLQATLKQFADKCETHYNECNFYLVVDTVMGVLHAANNFFECARPWELKAVSGSDVQNIENVQKLETLIAMTMDVLRLCGIVLQPIVPHLSEQLLNKLNVPQADRAWHNLRCHFANSESKRLADLDAVLFRRIILKDETDESINKQTQQQKTPNNKKQKEKKINKVNT